MSLDIHNIKAKIREHVWKLMEDKNIARFPRPVYGRIPNFVGAEEAARNLRKTPEWRKSLVVFCNPDSPQKHVRFFALLDSKKLIMASPRIKQGFIILDTQNIPYREYSYASTIRGAFKYGKIVEPERMPFIEMKITGCTAVDVKGGRLGKGHGYSDLEWGILAECGLVSGETVTATTVHDIQIVENVPMTKHDFPLDIVATPTRVIYTNTNYEKPMGIFWEEVISRVSEIPLLYALCLKRGICKQ
ncbi:MAG: 5-formyltetrahydrofolate cyclo-ligase [Crenarchaeota archaeon]|nr:5-formyltetrahydrofolate cyclo-ligase [Thermoproteota archaeon]MCR8453909.1 5-formyltetrahydrofolate cyclo-ligase [Thermoproteota archaeon]MCR8455264.1 5-formyltetrahydrofolate cyclo-ligase [Thermoproteota archaeon]MCR8463052.1 5-formyltetrahydrofolate cyclo-ligase [Thermoproteota archaeon]MCR8470630.1 5-formyltetrahydrofolate cyclo-ligase [Thermoproteota archaeon]